MMLGHPDRDGHRVRQRRKITHDGGRATAADLFRGHRRIWDDEKVVALRTEVERQARAQYDEGTITTADYVETRTDVLEARLTLDRHRVELAQARASYLTTLGLTPQTASDRP